MGVLSFLFGGDSTPVVFPTTIKPNAIATYEPEAVVFSEEESQRIEGGPPTKLRAIFNRWIQGNSTAVKRYKFQPYSDEGNIYGSIWVQFVGGTKQYNYPNVPWIEFSNMIRAASRGQFVNHVLRPLYSVGRGRYWRGPHGITQRVRGQQRPRRRKSWR